MLEVFRKASTTWWFRAFFLILAIAFGFLWGIGDVINRIGGGGNQTVISIGSRKISAREFEYMLARQIHNAEQNLNEKIDRKKAREMGIDTYVMQKLVNDTLLELEAERLGILVSDDMVRNRIHAEKVFQNQDGSFNRDIFKSIIERVGFSEKSYVELMRKELVRENILKAIAVGITAPKAMIAPLYRWQHEVRRVNGVLIEAKENLVKDTPTEEQLRTFYGENLKRFEAPEYRSVSALVFDPNKLINTIAISDQQAQEEFESRPDEYQGKTFEQVKNEIISFLKKQQANEKIQKLGVEIEDALGGGSTFEEVAKAHSLEIMQLPLLDKHGQPDPFSDQNQPKPLTDLEKAILEEGFHQKDVDVPGDVVDGADGKLIIAKVDKLTPSSQRPFHNIKDKLVPFWKQEKAFDAAKALAEEVAKALNEGQSPQNLEKRYPVKAFRTRIDRSGDLSKFLTKMPKNMIAQLFSVAKNKPVLGVQKDGDKTTLIVGFVSEIEKSSETPNQEKMAEFAKVLQMTLSNDILMEYIISIEKKNPVEVNKGYFKEPLETAPASAGFED